MKNQIQKPAIGRLFKLGFGFEKRSGLGKPGLQPGFAQSENLGNPTCFQTRNPGLINLASPGFRVWFYYFSLR